MDFAEPVKASASYTYNEVAYSNIKWFGDDNPIEICNQVCEMTGWTGGVEVLPPRRVRQ